MRENGSRADLSALSPHPGPLPRGEGESHFASRLPSSVTSIQHYPEWSWPRTVWSPGAAAGHSLSPRERARVRGKRPQRKTAGQVRSTRCQGGRRLPQSTTQPRPTGPWWSFPSSADGQPAESRIGHPQTPALSYAQPTASRRHGRLPTCATWPSRLTDY